MIKKQLLVALLLLLLIPAVAVGGGMLSNLINPELAAGHPNYVRNWHLLSEFKRLIFFGCLATVVALYFLGSFLVIRSKNQSGLWLFLAALPISDRLDQHDQLSSRATAGSRGTSSCFPLSISRSTVVQTDPSSAFQDK